MFDRYSTPTFDGVDPTQLGDHVNDALAEQAALNALAIQYTLRDDYGPVAHSIPHLTGIALDTASRTAAPASWLPGHADEAAVYLLPWAV